MTNGKKCLECGGEIHRDSRRRLESASFCGNPCKLAFQKRNPTRKRIPRATATCPSCKQEFSYLPSQRVRFGARYCSLPCKHIGQRATMTGRRPSGGVYTSRNTFRTMIRRRFIDRCAICGWAEAPNDVCHIVPRKNGGADTFENVLMLCPNHHRLFDRGDIPLEQILTARKDCLREEDAIPIAERAAA